MKFLLVTLCALGLALWLALRMAEKATTAVEQEQRQPAPAADSDNS